MKFADAKDMKRARELGFHSGANRSTPTEIAIGKASTMAKAITDRRKILGRLEAIANVWDEKRILNPFIHRCIQLWPNSAYGEAYTRGQIQSNYMKGMRQSWNEKEYIGVSKETLYQKGKVTLESGRTITGYEYENWDPVAIIIFNSVFKWNL